jgi:Tfp pilus assembly protein FimT
VISRRPAYTLFELILTTAVIAITTALAVPSLDGMYPSYKLNASVDAVRAAWALGRAHAIEEGRPYRFSVAPGSGSYRLALDDNPADGGGASTSDDDQDTRPFVVEEKLPQGVTFAQAQEENDQQSQQQQQPSQQSADGMSTVAVFMPDGTARDDAEIRFQVKGAMPKTLKLRGLTGSVTVQQQGGGGGR